MKTSIGILGGGITGLSVAYGLYKRGIDAVVYERNSVPGGVIQSAGTDGWLVELGPNTLMVRKKEVWDLLSDLQLDNEIRRAGSTSAKRFIVKNGVPLPLPQSLPGFIKSNLFSAGAKLRLLKEPFLAASNLDDESIASFISRRLGKEPLLYAVDPFVSGVYAGNSDRLSIRHTFSLLRDMEQNHGSLTRGILKNLGSGSTTERALISFSEGMQTLPRALHRRLGDRVRCNTEVLRLTPEADAWKVSSRSPEGLAEHKHEAIISTIPVHTLPKLFDPEHQIDCVSQISEIPYAPLNVLSLGFRRDQVDHPLDGFGVLIPRAESFQTLGTLFSSSLFPGRAPEDHVLLTSFIGGARNPELAHKPANELKAVVIRELRHLLEIKGPPVFFRHHLWEQAIPQYEVGYKRYLEAMEQLEERHPGLFLAGNYRYGVSVPDCIVNGIETARRVVMFLTS